MNSKLYLHPPLGQVNSRQYSSDHIWTQKIIELSRPFGKISAGHENARKNWMGKFEVMRTIKGIDVNRDDNHAETRNARSKRKNRISEIFILS